MYHGYSDWNAMPESVPNVDTKMDVQGWSATAVGDTRETNQDAVLVDAERGVFAVADGIGGKEQGARASETAVRAIRESLGELTEVLHQGEPAHDRRERDRVCDFLIQQFKAINRELYDAADGDMGTTCDLLGLAKGAGFVAHVGDSRVYLLRDGRIHQLTDDHTFAERIRREQERLGHVDELELNAHYEHVLTRSLGGEPEVDIDTLFVDVQPGDRFLLCTDGVTDVVSEEELLRVDESEAPEEFANRVVERAVEANTRDNTTAVVASVPDGASAEFEGREPVDTLRKVSFLEQIELFQGLDSQELLRILRIVYKEVYAEGETIIERGGTPNRMYMILEGEIVLEVEGHEVARLTAGQHFGEMALFGRQVRSADAVAGEDVILLVVPSDQFQRLVEVDDVELGNKLLRNLLNQAAARIRKTTMSLLEAREGEEAKAAAIGRADTLELDSDVLGLDEESDASSEQ